jgi:hypothetical protein
MTIQIGFDPSETLTSAERLASGKGWAAGNVASDQNGNEWLFVQAGAAIPQNNLVRVLASANQATVFTSAGVSGTAGAVKCYAVSASASIASGSYGWVMTKCRQYLGAALKVSASATGTYVPTGALYACASAQNGLVSSTATTTHFLLGGVTVATTATTSTTTTAVPVMFYHGIKMTVGAIGGL